MAAHYTNVTQEEVEEFLFPQGFKKIIVPGAVELIYAKRVDRDGLQLSLRIYTGINPSGNSRGVGEDAMRATVFWRKPDGTVKMAGGSKRVHRVAGWRKNLQNRLDKWEELLGPSCPDCGNPMVERDGKNGKFYGCSDYPVCKCTRPINYKPSVEECAAEAEIQDIEGGQP